MHWAGRELQNRGRSACLEDSRDISSVLKPRKSSVNLLLFQSLLKKPCAGFHWVLHLQSLLAQDSGRSTHRGAPREQLTSSDPTTPRPRTSPKHNCTIMKTNAGSLYILPNLTLSFDPNFLEFPKPNFGHFLHFSVLQILAA